jgi:hypothetical protein
MRKMASCWHLTLMNPAVPYAGTFLKSAAAIPFAAFFETSQSLRNMNDSTNFRL